MFIFSSHIRQHTQIAIAVWSHNIYWFILSILFW